jgi:NAD-dependent SIR2 family protein deacetylase
VEHRDCVVFAGAGISTETRYTHPNTFYDTLRAAVECQDTPPFPALVDRFEDQPNGRQKLIETIVDRFSYINGFRELRQAATRFHDELSTMPYLKTIVTTNWDRYFEEVCDATPFVYESDIPFWGTANRAVLKIHGSIDNYSSIVASSSDYERCFKRLRDGAIGAVLKQLFATKTFVFFGYSATDSDFLAIFQTIKSGLGTFARTHYLVSPFLDDSQRARLAELNIVGIKTDGAHLLSVVKQHMISRFCFAKDESYREVSELLIQLRDLHFAFVGSYKPAENPHLIYATVYQDGLIHALERIIDQRASGRFSDLHAVRGQIGGYRDMIANYLSKRDYWEMSYFSGYQVGLEFFDMVNMLGVEETGWPPPYFHPGSGFLSQEEYDAKIRPNPDVHKAALAQAKGILKRSGAENAEVVQHLPWAT